MLQKNNLAYACLFSLTLILLVAGQLLPPEPPAEDVSPPPPTADAPTVPPPLHMNCDTQESTPGHVSTTGQWPLKSTLPLNYLSYDSYPTVDWRLIQCLDLQAIQWTDESHHSTQNLKLRAKICTSNIHSCACTVDIRDAVWLS